MEPERVSDVVPGAAGAAGMATRNIPTADAAENLVGSPRRVAEQLEQMRAGGIRNLMLTNRGLVNREQTHRSLKLLAEQVMPKFRDG